MAGTVGVGLSYHPNLKNLQVSSPTFSIPLETRLSSSLLPQLPKRVVLSVNLYIILKIE